MKKNGKHSIQLSPRRYLANARATVSKSPIEYGYYSDQKYVAEAAGIAYLAAVDAIIEAAGKKGIEIKERPKSYEGISHLIEKLPQKNKLHLKFKGVYDILHSNAYYNRFNKVSIIKDGFKEVEEIIKMLN